MRRSIASTVLGGNPPKGSPMRSILLAAVLAASILVTHVQTADACGGGYQWQPTAHLVVTPVVKNAQSFALLSERLDATRAKGIKLARLDTSSFDTTATAFGRKLFEAQRLTLLGPAGTKLVQAKTTTWVDLAFDHEEAREAVIVPDGEFVIALDGHFKDATWESFDVIHGDTVTSFNGTYVQALVRHGDKTFSINGTVLEGYPLGIATVNGKRYVAVRGAESRNDVWLAAI